MDDQGCDDCPSSGRELSALEIDLMRASSKAETEEALRLHSMPRGEFHARFPELAERARALPDRPAPSARASL